MDGREATVFTVVGYIDYRGGARLVILGCFEGHSEFIGTRHADLAPYVHHTDADTVAGAYAEAVTAYDDWSHGRITGTSTTLSVSTTRPTPRVHNPTPYPRPARGLMGAVRRMFGRNYSN